MRKSSRINTLLSKAFPELEVLDATSPLTLFPSKGDFDNAVRQDPRHCGFANCAARICGSTQAHFFKRYVYLDRLGEDGKRRVYRYVTSRSVLETLSAFDSKRRFNISRAFVLRPPPPSQTIRGMRRANLKWRQSDVAKAIDAEREARSRLSVAERGYQQSLAIVERIRESEKPNSPKMRDSQKRVEAAKTQIAKARVLLEARSERATRLRRSSYATGKAKPKKTDLNVRNGSGWFTRNQVDT